MAQYSFKKDFTSAIVRGQKTQTIRAMRRRLPKVGDDITMYHGPRYSPSKLGQGKISQIGLITIAEDGIKIRWLDEAGARKGETEMKPGAHLDMFAVRDGFKNYKALLDWFMKEHPMLDDPGIWSFEGFITVWEHFQVYREEPKQ